jgi:preprotein translocase subunit SecA
MSKKSKEVKKSTKEQAAKAKPAAVAKPIEAAKGKLAKIQPIKMPQIARKPKKPSDKLADRTTGTKILQGIFGDAQKRTLRRLQKRVGSINALADKYQAMSDAELQAQTEVLRKSLYKSLGVKSDKYDLKKADRKKEEEALNKLLPEAFALVREASERVLGMRHFDVQLIGGMALHEGNVAEMKTGEGKTLVATLPVYLNALLGRGVHVVTVNDYLAQRDAGWMGAVYDFLGLKVGVIINEESFVYNREFENEKHSDPGMQKLEPATRREAYEADVTYGTNNEYGFDYLRDNMANDTKFLRQRELNFAIVDEVDSILIDEARTPLIISAPAGDNPKSYYDFADMMTKLTEDDYVFDEKRRSVALTDAGVERMQELLKVETLYSTENTKLVYHLDQALRAQVVFRRDKDYVVTKSGEVIIVDEHTGRLMQGRRYSEGLHQAIEAKEKVAVKEESMTLATISFQNFFRLYNKLSGMTGTAFTEAEEFQQIYSLDVVQIPPNKPIIRVDKDDLIYQTEAAKLKAVAAEIKEYHDAGRPVLVGSASIVKNELIADYLTKEGIPYEILNAKNNEREAEIIAKAGQTGAVTLATNMAGRGTDIKLGPGVVDLGGLVVIGSERHESRRIDNQLRGRGGRQGDPGTTQFFVSAEDDLARVFNGERLGAALARMGVTGDTPIQSRTISKLIEGAQKRVEGFNFDSRKNVVQYDNVINRHRRVIYMMRRKILEGEDLRAEIVRLIHDAAKDLTQFSSRVNKKFAQEFLEVFPQADEDFVDSLGKMRKDDERYKLAVQAIEEMYSDKEMEFSDEVMRKVERDVYLQVMDFLWMQHLENMQHLREGIHWRSVGQRDPLVEYRGESQKLFDGLQKQLREEVLRILLGLRRQDTAELADDEYDTELTKMAEGAVEKGVNEVSAGQKNIDDEFRDDGGATARQATRPRGPVKNVRDAENHRKNQAKKARKKSRQNKKSGRR